MKSSVAHSWVWVDTVLAVLVVAAICRLSSGFFNPTDFPVWSADVNVLHDCMGATHSGPCTGLSKFPLAYLANSHIVGGSQNRLAILNAIALLIPLGCLCLLQGWRFTLRAGMFYLLALLLSPLPAFYVRSGALEVQAGVVSGVFMAGLAKALFSQPGIGVSVATRVLLVSSGLLLPLYKDTLVVLVAIGAALVWCLRAWWAPGAERIPAVTRIKTLVIYVAFPVGLGLIAAIAYNQYRYGSPFPVAYMQEAAQTTPSLLKSVEFLFGSIMSPNGGVVVFWALPFGVALMGWWLRGLRVDAPTAALASLAAILSSVAFARWWAPFGWDAWGDRLMIQPMLAMLVACFLGVSPASVASNAKQQWVKLLFAAPVLVASAYYIVVPYVGDRALTLGASLWPGKSCDQMMRRLQTDAPTMGLQFWKTDDYYRCARERMLHVPAPKFQ